MLSFNELMEFMSPDLAEDIIATILEEDRELYKVTVKAIAEARKVRPVFLQRQPKPKRHQIMLQALSKPNMDMVSGNLLRGWLIKKHSDLLGNFLDALEIEHKDGMVEDLPKAVEDGKLKDAVDKILETHPREVVAVYLHTFNSMNDEDRWKNLDELLDHDERLQFM